MNSSDKLKLRVKRLRHSTFKFQKTEKPPTRKEWLNNLREAIQEVNNIKKGRRKGLSLQEFLDEL